MKTACQKLGKESEASQQCLEFLNEFFLLGQNLAQTINDFFFRASSDLTIADYETKDDFKITRECDKKQKGLKILNDLDAYVSDIDLIKGNDQENFHLLNIKTIFTDFYENLIGQLNVENFSNFSITGRDSLDQQMNRKIDLSSEKLYEADLAENLHLKELQYPYNNKKTVLQFKIYPSSFKTKSVGESQQ